ncbi:MAG: sigma-70 family RNA polymerase sigma factor [Trichodesmium sp. St16_bin2-tuft]|nr:sigma-70 family RNA polymerase sigma factor [Trichodesmium sp. St16_bin2-tuft]
MLRTDGKKSFDFVIQGLSQPDKVKNPQERKSLFVLASSIKNRLKQFHLEQVDFYDVVSDVYLRGIKKITSGENIKNPGAWIRVTSYNVILEMSRKQKKEQPDSEFLENQVAPKTCEENSEVQLNILRKSLENLSEKERLILELRFFQDLSWKEVRSILASKGEILTESNLKKKGSRALGKLKKSFFSSLNIQ